MFEPNTKVVCVDDKFPEGIRDFYNSLPKKGIIYTVRDIVAGQDFGMNRTIAVLLKELENLPNEHGIEPGFASWRFVEPEEIQDSESNINEEELEFV